jgi:hypothetical protein
MRKAATKVDGAVLPTSVDGDFEEIASTELYKLIEVNL